MGRTEVRPIGGAVEVTVTFGDERLAPYEFQSFSTPSLSLRVVLEPGDDVGAKVDDAFERLREMQEPLFLQALEVHCKHVGAAAMRAGGKS